jgi:predicted aldo/keto reductase-like oxidoreductase
MKPFGGGRLMDIELCFKFLRLYPDFIPVPGMQSLKELRQNIELIGKRDIFSEEDKVKKEKIIEQLGDQFCRQCGYCMPCEEKEIDIININFIEVYYKQFPEEEFWNKNFDRIIDNARECIECNKCSEKCPYHLDVPEIIKKNIRFFDRISKKRK